MFENIINCMKECFPFLEKWGYEYYSNELVQSDVFGERLLLVYISKKVNRRIKIYASKKFKNKPERFSVFIEQLNGQGFLLDDFLLERKLIDDVKKYINFNDELTEEQFSNKFCQVFEVHCEGVLEEIVSGKSWGVDDYDWSPYR